MNQRRPPRPLGGTGIGSAGQGRGHMAGWRSRDVVVAPDEHQVARQAVVPTGDGDGKGPGGGGSVRSTIRAAIRRTFERDLLVLGAILLLATAVRFIGIATRGGFDGDQGHDALTLLRFVRDGVFPLLGPPTSIGNIHHGAFYYLLLAPAAFISNADPTVIVSWIAAIGVAAVAATWWFARSVGGRVTAAIAGVLMAVSPAAIEESTFIWNPNPIPLFAALAFGCAWRAHATGSVRWWVPALAAGGMVVQLHVLGIVFMPALLALAASDAVRARRRAGHGPEGTLRAAGAAGPIIRSVALGLAVAALLFVPLAINELQTGFDEVRHAMAWFAAGGAGESPLDPIEGFAFTLFRTAGWPLVGLVTAAPVGAILTVSATLVLVAWLMITGRGSEGSVARWLGFTVLWSSAALTVLAPSLQSVVAGLPVDHYHAFLDPAVIVLVALAARSIARGAAPHLGADIAARTLITTALVGLLVLQVRQWPPARDPNGGWPAVREAGARVVELAAGRQIDIRGLPIFKTAEGLGFGVVVAAGADPAALAATMIATDRESALLPLDPRRVLVVVCDRLFESVLGDACGGPAEARYVARLTGGSVPPVLRVFDLSPRTSVTVFGP